MMTDAKELVERLRNERPANMLSVLELHLRAASLILSQQEEIDRCHARLEIDHVFVAAGDDFKRREVPMPERANMPDGITARDETIKLLDEQVASSQARIEQLEPILRQARELLADLARPAEASSVTHVWARCVEVEARARAVLASRVSG